MSLSDLPVSHSYLTLHNPRVWVLQLARAQPKYINRLILNSGENLLKLIHLSRDSVPSRLRLKLA